MYTIGFKPLGTRLFGTVILMAPTEPVDTLTSKEMVNTPSVWLLENEMPVI